MIPGFSRWNVCSSLQAGAWRQLKGPTSLNLPAYILYLLALSMPHIKQRSTVQWNPWGENPLLIIVCHSSLKHQKHCSSARTLQENTRCSPWTQHHGKIISSLWFLHSDKPKILSNFCSAVVLVCQTPQGDRFTLFRHEGSDKRESFF